MTPKGSLPQPSLGVAGLTTASPSPAGNGVGGRLHSARLGEPRQTWDQLAHGVPPGGNTQPTLHTAGGPFQKPLSLKSLKGLGFLLKPYSCTLCSFLLLLGLRDRFMDLALFATILC